MYLTVTDFCEYTGIKKNTVYSWKYRENWPEGLSMMNIPGRSTILIVEKKYEKFDEIVKAKKKQ